MNGFMPAAPVPGVRLPGDRWDLAFVSQPEAMRAAEFRATQGARSGRREQAAGDRRRDCCRSIVHIELREGVEQMCLDGGLADEQSPRDFAVGLSVRDKSQHF